MNEIILKSSARLSEIVVTQLSKGTSVDISYKYNGHVQGGVYQWDEVKQFVRELAEALDMTLEEAAPEVEPIVLPKDVYEEVERFMKYIYADEDNLKDIKRRADAKLWTNCRSDSGGYLATYIANNEGASIDIARIFMKELPYECEEEHGWVLKSPQGNYLAKAHLKDNGEWGMEFTADIGRAVKFSAVTKAANFANTLSHRTDLSVKEV